MNEATTRPRRSSNTIVRSNLGYLHMLVVLLLVTAAVGVAVAKGNKIDAIDPPAVKNPITTIAGAPTMPATATPVADAPVMVVSNQTAEAAAPAASSQASVGSRRIAATSSVVQEQAVIAVIAPQATPDPVVVTPIAPAPVVTPPVTTPVIVALPDVSPNPVLTPPAAPIDPSCVFTAAVPTVFAAVTGTTSIAVKAGATDCLSTMYAISTNDGSNATWQNMSENFIFSDGSTTKPLASVWGVLGYVPGAFVGPSYSYNVKVAANTPAGVYPLMVLANGAEFDIMVTITN